jgi:o-succinylbenzoate synthase
MDDADVPGLTALDDLDLHPFVVPMRVRFRRVTERAGVLLRGPAGWGEFSPFPEYDAAYASRWLDAAVEAATTRPPPARRHRIPVNVTVPAVAPDRAHTLVAASGCSTAKVKVAEAGQQAEEDLERVAAVRDALGPRGRIRVDANGAWDVVTAAQRLRELAQFDLEYAEQPVPTLEEMARLRGLTDVPLAADESVRTAEDPLRVAGLEAADIVVLKVQPLGGVRAALAVAGRAGLPAVVSSALETSIGLAAGAALAAALPRLPYACGLGTATLLTGDVVRGGIVPEGGAITPVRPVPAPDLLARWGAPRDVARGLLDRLRAADEVRVTRHRND